MIFGDIGSAMADIPKILQTYQAGIQGIAILKEISSDQKLTGAGWILKYKLNNKWRLW